VGLFIKGKSEAAYIISKNSEVGLCVSLFMILILKSPKMYVTLFSFLSMVRDSAKKELNSSILPHGGL
jgi:hypothetical protein